MIDEKTYQQIDAFLKGEMIQNEMIAFKKKLKLDTSLMEEFNIQKDLFQIIGEGASFEDKVKAEKIEAIKLTLNSLKTKQIKTAISEAQQLYNKPKSLNFSIKSLLAVAATVALIVSIFYFNSSKPSTMALYKEYKNWNDLPSLTVRDEAPLALAKAERYFKNNEYKNAIELFKKSVERNPNNPNLLSYLGISYLENNQFDLALKTFSILENSQTIDSSKAYWYKALTYLKKNDKEMAIIELNKIIENSKHYNFSKTNNLLIKLKQIKKD